MNYLYYLNAETEDGENLDLMVSATSPERAVDYWLGYYEIEDNFQEKFVRGTPEPGVASVRVSLVAFNLRVEGPLYWGPPSEIARDAGVVQLVGYVLRA